MGVQLGEPVLEHGSSITPSYRLFGE
jgi:hypothetical protein